MFVHGRLRGVVLEDGIGIAARIVLSNADPKRTFLNLFHLRSCRNEFLQRHPRHQDGRALRQSKLSSSAEEPRFTGYAARPLPPQESSLYTLVPSLEFAERCYDIAKFGEIPEELWVDCVIASNADSSLAPPGRHIMTCFVQYVPYRLRDGNWDSNRELLGDRVIRKISEYAPNVPDAVVARQVLTPLDLERTYGLTEGNIFHGELNLEQLFFMRPVPAGRRYRTPITRTLSMRRRRASGRRSNRRAGPQRRQASAPGLEKDF